MTKKDTTAANEKARAVEEALTHIKEQFGEGSIMRLKEAKMMQVEAIPSGCLSLDLSLGVGGLPRGRIVEIYGPESSGKTTLAQHAIAEAQRLGGIAAFIDAEHALDPDYAQKIGININDLIISQPDTGEQALEIVENLVRSNALDIIVIDSVAALTPKAEIEGAMGDTHMGLQARLMSQALRKLAGIVAKSGTIVVFINQTRQKIGVYFGDPTTTPGGTALKFYSSVRIEIHRAAKIKQGEAIIGNRVKVKIVKNKVAPPFKTCEFDIMYNEGISITGDIIDLGVEIGVVKKSGTSYAYKDEKLGVGREKARQALRENSKLADEIKKKIWEEIKGRQQEEVAETTDNTE
ncbi:MAG: recombinase RecA [Candidatus Jacksonbacteria bacterium]|nr:recombinase RecA [Candidatus Jacksonbacteria bacterium]